MKENVTRCGECTTGEFCELNRSAELFLATVHGAE